MAISHRLVAAAVQKGDKAVDATCGNGYDTVFLAQLVGDQGRVLAFDIQAAAIENTRNRLTDSGLSHRVQLVNANHAKMDEYLPDHIAAAMFNLGYLPGGNHQITTSGQETTAALEHCIQRLRSGGLITVVAYPGHPGGGEEIKQIKEYLSRLDQKEYETWQLNFMNQRNQPPCLLVVSKLDGGRL